jgi:dienelactone hydrolase
LAKDLFDACIIVHPGPLEYPKDFERVDASAPWYFQCAEWDQWFPDEQRDQARKYLQDKGVSVKLSVYEKTIHGFAVSHLKHPPDGRPGVISLTSGEVELRE